jgi:hypothetical protein
MKTKINELPYHLDPANSLRHGYHHQPFFLFSASFSQNHLSIQSKGINFLCANQIGLFKQPHNPIHTEQIIRRVLVSSPMERHVDHRHASRLQRPLDLSDKSAGIQCMVEHIGEFEIEGIGLERLLVEVPLDNERRGGDEVHAN